MNAVVLLLGLLMLSYVGSALKGSRAIRGFGLPSGAEYLCLGFALGSHGLGIISAPLLSTFEPLLVVGAGWIAFVAGVGYTQIGQRRIAIGRALVGVLSTALVAVGMGAAVWFALPVVAPALAEDRLLMALGVASVTSGSTRQAVRWVVQRYAARGPLADTLADYARASALVPVLGLSILLAHFPEPGLSAVSLAARIGLSWGIGGILGLVAVLLVGRGLTKDEVWGILVGTSLLSVGVAARLGLSSVAAAFALGLTLGVLSPRRAELAAMLRPTERAVLLPLCVLAGALVNLREAPLVALLVPLGLAARFGTEIVRGTLLAAVSRPARKAGPLLGFSLVSTGDVSLACAVSVALSFKSPAALTVLAVGAASLLAGELVGPLALRRSLTRAGELEPVSTREVPMASFAEPRAATPTGSADFRSDSEAPEREA